MDIDYNSLTDLAGADGHILAIDYIFGRPIYHGVESVFDIPMSIMYGKWGLPSTPWGIVNVERIKAVWPCLELQNNSLNESKLCGTSQTIY